MGIEIISFCIFIFLHKVALEFKAGSLKWKNVCLLLKYNNLIEFCTCCLIVWFGETISLTRCCVTVGRALSLTALMWDSWNKCSNHKLLLFRNRIAIRALFTEIPKKRHVKELMARISGDLLCKTGVISVLHLTTSHRDWITRTWRTRTWLYGLWSQGHGFIAQLVEHRTGKSRGHGFKPCWSPEFFSGFFTQLHKLRSLLRSFLHFRFISAVHIWFISYIINKDLHNVWIHVNVAYLAGLWLIALPQKGF